MADRKIPCADCDDCVPCEMVERCIKHDPAPPTFGNYTRLTTPGGTHIEPCAVCAADPEVWQYIAKPGEAAQKVVMCSHSNDIGPHDALAGGGCPLYMPPQSFYRPTIREAVKHWNEYGKALSALRRKNGRTRAKVLRGNAGVRACPKCRDTGVYFRPDGSGSEPCACRPAGVEGLHPCGHMKGSCPQCHQCLHDQGATSCPTCEPAAGVTAAPAPEPEPCWCDKHGIGEPGVSCGDCPTRDYKAARGVQVGTTCTRRGAEDGASMARSSMARGSRR